MTLFTIRRLSFEAGNPTEVEETVHADYYEVHNGVLTFYSKPIPGEPTEKVLTYGVAVLVLVKEATEPQIRTETGQHAPQTEST